MSQGCAGGSWVKELFSTQLLKANSSKLRFPRLPLCVSLWDTLGLRSAAKARHLQMLSVGVRRLSATVAGSRVNQSFQVALPRPSLYHQLSKEDQQGFKTPKLVILEHKLE